MAIVKILYSKIKGHPQLTEGTAYMVLFAISLSHLLNDMIQSVIPAIYPILKDKFGFTFAQIGLITLVFQTTSSILQPFTGWYADKHPKPYALSIGMLFTLTGLCLLASARTFALILLSVSVIGWGSSVFHPEATRITRLASGGKKSLAQSIFQVGGNGGSALGPLLAALIVLPYGQGAIGWFALAAILAALVLARIGSWYQEKLADGVRHPKRTAASLTPPFSRQTTRRALLILVLLVFSKYFYNACMTSYFTFFLMDKFSVSVQDAQFCLFVYLLAFAIGTLAGGVLSDRFDRKYVIWGSILGAAPFALLLPYVNLFWTIVLAGLTGLIIASAFSAIVVYATDLLPHKVGLVAGVFFGLMFGLGGLGSAFFGWLADQTSVGFIFEVSAWLPLLGIVAGFLPNGRTKVGI